MILCWCCSNYDVPGTAPIQGYQIVVCDPMFTLHSLRGKIATTAYFLYLDILKVIQIQTCAEYQGEQVEYIIIMRIMMHILLI